MKTLTTSIDIRAPRAKIWKTITGPDTFGDWCAAFNPGCFFEGDWSEGSEIRFLGIDSTTGKTGGMVSKIVENKPGEVIAIRHVGVVENGVEVTEGPIAEQWIGAREEYRLSGGPEIFTLEVTTDVADEWFEYFEKSWRLALGRLRELAEQAEYHPETDLVLELTLPISREQLWRGWTDENLLTEWFCPAHWKTVEAKIEPWIGGAFTTVMQGPGADGQMMTMNNVGSVLEAIPNEKLTFTDSFDAGFRPRAEPFLTATVQFWDRAEGTFYRVVARHTSGEKRDEHAAMGFTEGWTAAVNQLVAYYQR